MEGKEGPLGDAEGEGVDGRNLVQVYEEKKSRGRETNTLLINEGNCKRKKIGSDYFRRQTEEKKRFYLASPMKATLLSVALKMIKASGSITGLVTKCRCINIHLVSRSNPM